MKSICEKRNIIRLLILCSLLPASGCQREANESPGDLHLSDEYGIVRVSTGNLRAAPSRKTELVDQVLLGHTVKLLSRRGNWYFIRTEYDYSGWLTAESVFSTGPGGLSQWQQPPRARVNCNYTIIREQPDDSSIPVADVTLNALLKIQQPGDQWTKVSLPDGRSGFIESRCLGPLETAPASSEAIVRTARSMIGVPYLWGGNSTKANDCSGFTQTVFRANGIELPRDAGPQAVVGSKVAYDFDFNGIRPGDLLFFGSSRDITHTGISLGGPHFIHQSGCVRESSLSPDDPNCDEYCRRTLQRVKRVIPEAAAN